MGPHGSFPNFSQRKQIYFGYHRIVNVLVWSYTFAKQLNQNSRRSLAPQIDFQPWLPRTTTLRQGKQFHGEVMRTLTQFLGIIQLFTSPYHPQTNGLTKRLNKTIKQIITTFVDPLHQDWDEVLPFVVHAYNTSVQASTQISPFRSLYGRNPRLPREIQDPSLGSTLGDATDWWLSLQQLLALLWHAAQHNLRIMQLQQKRHYDNGCIQMQYKEGDKAWVYYPIRRKGLSESLMHRWIGPYVVLKKLRDTTYRLLRCSNNSTTTAHVVRMKPYYDDGGERA